MMFRGGQRLAGGAVKSHSALKTPSDIARNQSRATGTMTKFGLPGRYGLGEKSVW